jgi:hypothetical protein
MCFNIRGLFSSGASGEMREEVANVRPQTPNLSTFGRQSVAVRPERSVSVNRVNRRNPKKLKQEADRLQVTISALRER